MRKSRCIAVVSACCGAALWLFPVTQSAAQSGATAPMLAPPTPTGVVADGRIIDAATGESLVGATVTVEDTGKAAVTDGDGRFSLGHVEFGATVIISADGYDIALANVDGEWSGEFALLPADVASEVIELRGSAPTEVPGATALDRTEVARLPGTGNDLLASLDVLPGITQPTGPPRGGVGVVIRGSAPEDSKILIDGFEVPLLYHIGLRSILPTESIDSLSYLPGGFDVAYGRASSGIIAVTTRGGEGKASGQAEMSVIDGGVLAKGPAGPGSLLVAMRRSTVDLILPSLIPDDADFSLVTLPRYYDLQARYDLPVNSRWKVAFSAIGTDDAVTAFGDDDPDPDERFSLRTRFLRLIGSARWRHGDYSAQIAGSLLGQGVGVEVGRNINFNTDRYGATVRGQIAWNKKWIKGLGNVELRAGGEVDVSRWNLSMAVPDFPDEGEPNTGGGPPTESDVMTRFDGTIDVPDLAAWTSAAANLSPRVRLTTGVRVDAFMRTDDVVVQPRGNLSVKLDRATTARLVFGAYSRPAENQLELLDQSLDPERSTHLILGLERKLAEGFKVQAQAYYTDRYRLLTQTPMGTYANQGEGATYGAELLATLRRGPWFGFVSYSYSRSTRIDSEGADERLFDYDQPHDLNVSASWKSGRWQLGARFQYTSGLPYTPVLGAIYDSDADTYLPLYADVNSERVPGHHQLDVRLDYSWRFGYVKMSAFLDIQNAYLNAQLIQYQYNFDYSERNAFESIPILPSIGLRGVL